MIKDIHMADKGEGDSIVVYAENIRELEEVLNKLEEQGIEITFQNSENCILNLERCVLDTISQRRPNLVLIETVGRGDGLNLYEMIRDEGTIENIPVFFIGPVDDAERMEVLKLGALQYIEKPINEEELILKINNFIKVSKAYAVSNLYDWLTGVHTRKYGEEIAKKSLEMAGGQRQPFTLLAIDMDNMSGINTKLGKKKGDELLQEAVEIFKKYLTPNEFIFRYSGERFVILFPNLETEPVLDMANTMQREINSFSSKYGVDISFTGGISSMQGYNVDYESLIKMAFHALIAGKQDGKSRTYIHTSGDRKIGKKTLLIVTEDRVMLSILSVRYTNKGYEVFTAENSEEALEIIKNNNIRVVVTSFAVPGITSSEFIGSLREESRKSKILTVLPRRDEQSMNLVLKAGAEDYIVKPFSPAELDLRIEKLSGQW